MVQYFCHPCVVINKAKKTSYICASLQISSNTHVVNIHENNYKMCLNLWKNYMKGVLKSRQVFTS